MKYRRFPILVIFVSFLLLAGCRPGLVSTPESIPSRAAPAEVTPIQTPTPAQTAALALPIGTAEETRPDDLNIPYTENNPLTDPEEILRILDILQGRELAWFSRPGWLQFTTNTADASDYTRIEHLWVHVTDDNLACREQFVYFESEGIILPYTIRPEQGIAGRGGIHPKDLEHERTLIVEQTYGAGPACTLKSNWIKTFQVGDDDNNFIIHDEAAHFRTFVNRNAPGIEGRFRAWVEEVEGEPILVVELERIFENSSLAGGILDPLTGTLNSYVRELHWDYIDLETGLQRRTRGEYIDENGRSLNTWRSGTNIGVLFHYKFYEVLPEPVALAYDQSVQALRVILQGDNQ